MLEVLTNIPNLKGLGEVLKSKCMQLENKKFFTKRFGVVKSCLFYTLFNFTE